MALDVIWTRRPARGRHAGGNSMRCAGRRTTTASVRAGAARAAPSAWQAGATPCHGAPNYAPNFERGVPTSWVYGWSIEYYNGRAIDVHGNPIGPEYHDGHFPAERFDPNDPPQFESEAAYLDRHSLLLPSERRRLTRADSSRQYCRLNSGPKLNEHGMNDGGQPLGHAAVGRLESSASRLLPGHTERANWKRGYARTRRRGRRHRAADDR